MKDADGEDLAPDQFFGMVGDLAGGEASPMELAALLIADCPEFVDLRLGNPVVLFLMRYGAKERGGKAVLGEMIVPRFQGGMAPVGSWLLAEKCGGQYPDFVCILDHRWWRAATEHQRRALIHHELKHIGIKLDGDGEKKFDDDGNPIWELKAHDLEEFRDTVRRFGDFVGDVAPFLEAAREGGVA